MSATVIKRWGYKNTSSSAGKPTEFYIPVDRVRRVRVWINGNGNPSYTLLLDGGDWIYTVDDFGAMNDLGHVELIVMDRKRDLFPAVPHKQVA